MADDQESDWAYQHAFPYSNIEDANMSWRLWTTWTAKHFFEFLGRQTFVSRQQIPSELGSAKSSVWRFWVVDSVNSSPYAGQTIRPECCGASFQTNRTQNICMLSCIPTKRILLSTTNQQRPGCQYYWNQRFHNFMDSQPIMTRPCRHSPFLSRTGNVLHTSINWLSHAHPLQKENIPLHSCNLQVLHGLEL